MNRLKFVLFALLALFLGAGQLYFVSRIWAEREEAASADRARRARAALTTAFEVRRQNLHALAIRAASLPSAAAAGKGALNAERFSTLHKEVAALIPDKERGSFFLAVVNDGAAWAAHEGSEPVKEGVDGVALLQSAAEGGVGTALDRPRLLQSAQVAGGGHLVLGLALFSDASLDSVVKDQGLAGAAVLERGNASLLSGAEAKALPAVARVLGPGRSDVTSRGRVRGMGPLQLPVLTGGDLLGGRAPLARASRFAIEGTPLEGVVLFSTQKDFEPLAEAQIYSLLLLMGLALLAVGFVLWVKNGPAAEAEAEAEEAQPNGPPLNPEAEANPDAFQFPAHAPEASPEEAFAPNRQDEPPTGALLAPAPAVLEAAASAYESAAPSPFDSPAASPFNAPSPFDAASPFGAASESAPPESFNPEATRVAMVPPDLLRASSQGAAAVSMAPPELPAALPVAPAVQPSPDEAHYQDVYREFVATRERCGESADGLTYEKFAQKLRKNRDQLVPKLNCRTVRFQVYVKEGKAALKAVPIK